MIRDRYIRVAGATLGALAFVATSAFATPNINSAVLKLSHFNDCPTSTITGINNYPASISVEDHDSFGACFGWANLHAWSFSADGSTAAEFANNAAFSFSCEMTINRLGGEANDGTEAGIRISPWWSPFTDGRINCRIPDGEIACFGGRLPFYTFTGSHGMLATAGTPITLEMIYRPNGLSMASPGTITYNVTIGATSHTSGPLAFDMGNPAEDPPYGLWGILNQARAGGFMQGPNGSGPDNHMKVTWNNIQFSNDKPTATETSTWGKLKTLYR